MFRLSGVLVLTGLLGAAWLSGVDAGGLKKSDAVVKVAAKHSKTDASGNQQVTLTLDIDDGWHIYANPIKNDELVSNQTVVKVRSKSGTDPKVTIEYPAGKAAKSDVFGSYQIYEKKVEIRTQVQRAPGDTGPLDFTIRLQSCTKTECLIPGTVHVVVPAE